MTVWVLMDYNGDEYEGDTSVFGVYSTLEKAVAEQRASEQEADEYSKYWIDEWEVL